MLTLQSVSISKEQRTDHMFVSDRLLLIAFKKIEPKYGFNQEK